jgi:ribokinase
MKPRIALLGSSNTDLVITAPRLPQPGETLLGGDFRQCLGGKGANQAVAAARAGAHVTFIGAYGDDRFGIAAKAALCTEGIDTAYFVCKPDRPSGVALIFIGGEDRQNQIVVARSANDEVTAADVEAAFEAFASADVALAHLETPLSAVYRAAEIANEASVPFVLNPAPVGTLPMSLLRLVHTITPNEHEAELITGERSPEQAAATLLSLGCKQVVITLGEKGALAVSPEGSQHIPAPQVKVVDTVGAGDCFTAWLAVAIAESLPFESAVQRAVKAASAKVTRAGAQDGMPYLGELV